jgi:peptide-methionine (S)-S-oxide reductase
MNASRSLRDRPCSKKKIYYYTAEQETQARESLAQKQREWKEQIVTELLPARRFYPAEDYHQQYLKKGGQSAKKRCSDPIRCYG